MQRFSQSCDKIKELIVFQPPHQGKLRQKGGGDLPLGETPVVDLKVSNLNQCTALEVAGFAL